MLGSILSCIRSLTLSAAGIAAADVRLIAAGLLGLAGENGATAAPLSAIAAELDRPADHVLAVLQALAAAGLVALQVPPLAGDVAETWIVVWWAGFAGAGVTVNVYSCGDGPAETGGALTRAGARAVGGACLFVCSDPPQDHDLDNIKTNKQTAGARSRTCEGAADDTGRIVALLTDPAVTAGLLVKSSGAPVGCFRPDQAREIAGVVLRAGGSFDSVLGNVCQWRREVDAGRVFSPLPALRSRLERGFDGSITAADRALPWFREHSPDEWTLRALADMDAKRAARDGAEADEAVNVYSEPAPALPGWVDDLRINYPRVAELLVDAEAVPADDGDGWIVRVGRAGLRDLQWLQTRGGRLVGVALARWAKVQAFVVPVRFVDGTAAGAAAD